MVSSSECSLDVDTIIDLIGSLESRPHSHTGILKDLEEVINGDN